MINPKDITVISVVGDDGGLSETMVQSVLHFSKSPPSFIIADNGNNAKLKRIFNFITLVKNNKDANHNNTSVRHAAGLNLILPMVKTKYTAIVESDVVVLRNDWFDFDINKYDMMTALKKKEYGGQQLQLCFMIFKTEKVFGVDFMPIKVTNKEGTIKRDTGFRVYDKIGDEKKIFYLRQEWCKSGETKVFLKAFNYKQFELFKDNGFPIAAHFGRGSDISRVPGNSLGHPIDQRKAWIKAFHNYIKK